MADYSRIDFDRLDWTDVLPGLRAKVFQDAGRTVRLVEFQGGFEEPDWCEKGHVGFVVSGRLTVRFDARVEIFKAGEALLIPAGAATRHKVQQPADQSATLFLTEPA